MQVSKAGQDFVNQIRVDVARFQLYFLHPDWFE